MFAVQLGPRHDGRDGDLDASLNSSGSSSDAREVGQRLEAQRASRPPVAGSRPRRRCSPGSRRPGPRRPRPSASGGSGHGSPSRARSLFGSSTIAETPWSAHSSTSLRISTVFPEPDPAKIAVCFLSDSSSTLTGRVVVDRPAEGDVRHAARVEARGRHGRRGPHRRSGLARTSVGGDACRKHDSVKDARREWCGRTSRREWAGRVVRREWWGWAVQRVWGGRVARRARCGRAVRRERSRHRPMPRRVV